MKQVFSIDEVNWEEASRMGITQELLTKTDNMEKFLAGEKTNLLNDLTISLNGMMLRVSGKLRLAGVNEGKTKIIFHGVKSKIEIPKQYLGYEFSEQDKKNLIQDGSLGKLVTLIDKGTERMFLGYLGVDKDTNEIVALKAEKITIPKTLKGVELSNEQRKKIIEGKAVEIYGMKDDKGNTFSAKVQINPAKKSFSFKSIKEKQEQKQAAGIKKSL